MSVTEALEPDQLTEAGQVDEATLAELAASINADVAEVQAATNTALQRAFAAGNKLLEAKSRVPFGEWVDWCEANLTFHPSMARTCMRLARCETAIRAQGIERLNHAVRHLPEVTGHDEHRGRPAPPEWLKGAARDMRAQGLSYRVIAEELGVSPATATRWADPKKEKRYREITAASGAKRKAAARALEREQREKAIKQAVRKSGAALSEAYAMAERMQDVIAQAHRESNDPEVREALSMAGTHHRRMRDQIVLALGVQPINARGYVKRPPR
jgi:transposase